MPSPTDHAAEARVILDRVSKSRLTSTEAAVLVAGAQAQATLAVAEQQRIANLLTVAGWVADSTKEDFGHDLDKLRVGIAGEVWEGLGL